MKNLKVLIVEDEDAVSLYLTKVIEKLSEEILFAKTGLDAVEVCRKNTDIDLVLMDIRMPIMDGYDATRKIREFNKEVIIIAQTVYAFKGDKQKAVEAGCNDHISKPINKEELFKKIENYLSTK
jgi:CheY-like chemotaxis protein